MSKALTKSERKQIGLILSRRANEIAGFCDDYRKKPEHYGSVEFALTREMDRLRHLAERVNPAEPDDEDES